MFFICFIFIRFTFILLLLFFVVFESCNCSSQFFYFNIIIISFSFWTFEMHKFNTKFSSWRSSNTKLKCDFTFYSFFPSVCLRITKPFRSNTEIGLRSIKAMKLTANETLITLNWHCNWYFYSIEFNSTQLNWFTRFSLRIRVMKIHYIIIGFFNQSKSRKLMFLLWSQHSCELNIAFNIILHCIEHNIVLSIILHWT